MRSYVVKQSTMFGCGLACVKSIFKFLHKEESNICFSSKKQMTMLDIINTFSKEGIKSKGFEINPDNIKNVKTPFIAHLKIGLSNHYVVVYKYSQKKVLIMEPFIGRMLLVRSSLFIKFWTKKAIILDRMD